MKTRHLILFFLLISILLRCSQSTGDYPISPVPFTDVQLDDDFWSPRMETNRKITIPYAYQQCEETHRIDNFAMAGGLKEGAQQGYRFNDSDVYKVIEGAAYALHLQPDPELEATTDRVIDLIAAAQEEDGYLFSAKTAFNEEKPSVRVKDRWDNIRDDHELYCVGHLYEAAIAYFQATGKRQLLDVAIKNADLIDSVFGPEGNHHPPGHQEIEIGLARLYRLTSEKRYLDLAKFFLDMRGDSTGHTLYGKYAQDHKPVVEQTKAVGHSVRAGYLFTGMADIAALTGNQEYIEAIQTIWNDVVGNKLYLTGGIGATGGNEGFGGDYHLPNASAYCETCASIANAMWNHRLYLMTGDTKYMDIVERVIYNSFLSGVGMEGNCFFYPNHLQSYTGLERESWFPCACCPSNIVRFLPSIPGYAFAHRGNDLFVNLYLSGSVSIPLKKQAVNIGLESRYPWDGTINLIIDPDEPGPFTLHIRVPGWAMGRPVGSDLYHYIEDAPVLIELKVNGEKQDVVIDEGYIQINRDWKSGDNIVLKLPMPIRFVQAHENVEADRGRLAIERGPIVFAAEGVDNESGMVRHLLVSEEADWRSSFEQKLLGGVQIVQSTAVGYRLANDGITMLKNPIHFDMIPYYAWAHRGETEMAVWLARKESAVIPLNKPTLASRSQVTASFGRNPEAVNDQLEPQSSIDHEIPRFAWWPHKGTTEWIQYDFPKYEEVSIVDVYWFDDTGRGQCRVPKSWRILYLEDGQWKRAWSPKPYGVAKDQYNRVVFETVYTKSIRLEIQSQDSFAGGVLEWKVE